MTRIRDIIFSGQMQDVIALNGELNLVHSAILYLDGRAEGQAKQLTETYQGGVERFLNTVGNRLEGCLPLPRLIWLREHEPGTCARTCCVLTSSKDYLIAQLIGECVGDVVACSTVGAMNIRNGQWDAELHEVAEIGTIILPHLHNPQNSTDTVAKSAARRTSLSVGTAVYVGIGDADATTLTSGISHPGQYNINTGTSGWIATVSPEPFTDKPGAADLVFGVEKGLANTVPFLDVDDVHKWITGVFSGGGYAEAHQPIEIPEPGSNGALYPSYLVGKRLPVVDPNIRGTYMGLDPDAAKTDMMHTAFEDVAFPIC